MDNNNIHLITYATHSEGTFNELLNNKHKIHIEVLGWGRPWNGYMDKINYTNEYIKTLPDNDIIIFIDGFDSEIVESLPIIKKRFLELNSDIVLSQQDYSNYLQYYIQKKHFGSCKYNYIANAGLYAGYNNKIQKLLDHIQKIKYSDDDQSCLNHACQYFDNLTIDIDNKLFHNLNHYERLYGNDLSNACIISTPGVLTWNRIYRSFFEYNYIQLIYKEVLLFLVIIIILYCKCF
jgi:hypothetical protein